MLRVEDYSYSILREVESLSRLNALTLYERPGDVIYNNNFSLSSKLTRYNVNVGPLHSWFPSMDDYDKKIALLVHETVPLGDWIHQLLKESEAVHSTGEVSNNVLSELQVNELQNVKDLSLCHCDSVTHLLNIYGKTHEVIKFPNLYKLELQYLKCLTHFYSDNVEGIEFPRLRSMCLDSLPEFHNFWPTPNNSNPLFHEKVSCPNLEVLAINGANNMSTLCSHQLPTDYFAKLKMLNVSNCEKLRNLMSLLVARGLQNLRNLEIGDCESMEEVIIEEEQQGEGIITLFTQLEELNLARLPKLGHFFRTNHALEIPSLRELEIEDCPKMKMFVEERISVSTPNIKSVNNDDEVKVVDPNKAMFSSKPLEKLVIGGSNNNFHQLPYAHFTKLEELRVQNCEKLRNLMSLSVARDLLNLQILEIDGCESMEEVIIEEEKHGEGIITLFPMLEELKLVRLPKLGHFFLTERALKFSSLRKVQIEDCPKMKTFVQQGIANSTPSLESVDNDDEEKVDDLNKAMFNSKVSCTNLEELYIKGADSMSALCSHQLPTDYFTKLGELTVQDCGKLRNVMSLLVARGLHHLQEVRIDGCESMEEVIIDEEKHGEGVVTLFPMLECLYLFRLPKLRHFFLTEHALKFPFLWEVEIDDCPKIETFVQEGICVSTPSLESVKYDDVYAMVEVDDLNKWIHRRFTSKEQQASQSTTHGNESEASDGNECEASINGDEYEANEGDESEANDGDDSK